MLEAFGDSWFSFATRSRTIHSDQGSELTAEMQEWTELYATLGVPVARGAHHLGFAERRIGSLEETVEPATQGLQLEGAAKVLHVGILGMAAGNRLFRKDGYSTPRSG